MCITGFIALQMTLRDLYPLNRQPGEFSSACREKCNEQINLLNTEPTIVMRFATALHNNNRNVTRFRSSCSCIL